ncbi:MAG: nuclear transport factor 2 family protein [Solirubrobacterales bacterium]
MSQENVQLVRDFMAAANRRDFETMDSFISDNFVFHSIFAASEGRVFKGHSGLREYFEALEGSFDELELPVDEAIDAGAEQVVLVVRVRGRGKASGVPVEHRFGQVWTVTHGAIREIVSYPEPDEALGAAGMRDTAVQ